MAFVSIWQRMMYHGCKETLNETPNSKEWIEKAKRTSLLCFLIEFEYRISRSIKGDINSVLGRIKCSYPSTPYIQPAIKCQELLIPILFWRAWVLRAWRRSLRALSVGPAVGVEGLYSPPSPPTVIFLIHSLQPTNSSPSLLHWCSNNPRGKILVMHHLLSNWWWKIHVFLGWHLD